MGRSLALLALALVFLVALAWRTRDVPPPAVAPHTVEAPRTAAPHDTPPVLTLPRRDARRAAAEPAAPPASTLPQASVDAPLLVGRFVLADGAPYGDRDTQVSLARGEEVVRSQPCRSDAAGRFAFEVRDVEDPLDGLRFHVRERRKGPPTVRTLCATLDLPPLTAGRTIDLGDVVLASRTTGVRVRLVEASGAGPEEEVWQQVELWSPSGERRHDTSSGRRGARVLCFDAGAEEGWVVLDLRSQDPWYLDPTQAGARLRAVAGRTGVAARAGDSLELRVGRSGTIRGNVIPHPRAFAEVRVCVRPMPPSGQGGSGEASAWTRVEGDGRFELTGLDAGPRRVEFLHGQLVLFAIDDVQVSLGQLTDDPRLAGIDLAALLQVIELRVVDGDGRPIPTAAATLSCGEHLATTSAQGEGETLSLVLPARETCTAWILVHAKDYQPEVLEAPFVDATVALRPSRSVPVRATRAVQTDIGTHEFLLRLRRTDVRGPVHRSWTVWLPFGQADPRMPDGWDGVQPVDLSMPGAGRYELEVLVLERQGRHFGRTPDDPFVGTGVFVDVDTSGAPIVVDVPDDLLRFDT